MNEQDNKTTTEEPGNPAKPQTDKEIGDSRNTPPNESSEVHIEPSESQDQKSETDNESGDPGRTPGKAEG